MKTLKRKIKKLIYRIGQILIYFGKPDSPFGEEIQARIDLQSDGGRGYVIAKKNDS